MEGKLFKMVEGYTLSLTGSIDDLYGISNKELADDHGLHKLSLKNCEAIVNGYDLDELALLELPFVEVLEPFQKLRREQWVKGFQKALEILGDKKFTKEDMGRIMVYGYDKSTENEYLSRIPFDEYIQSLQQTEWDVEIEMEQVYDGLDEMAQKQYRRQPKLDENKCLILKRK